MISNRSVIVANLESPISEMPTLSLDTLIESTYLQKSVCTSQTHNKLSLLFLSKLTTMDRNGLLRLLFVLALDLALKCLWGGDDPQQKGFPPFMSIISSKVLSNTGQSYIRIYNAFECK